MFDFLLIAAEANKILDKAIKCNLSNDIDGYNSNRELYLLFLSACGWTEIEFNKELISWIDSQWDNPTYHHNEPHRLPLWN